MNLQKIEKNTFKFWVLVGTISFNVSDSVICRIMTWCVTTHACTLSHHTHIYSPLPPPPPPPPPHTHTLSHTGAVMESLAWELLNLRVCTNFIPRHARNLANEFRCYSNYKTSLDSSSEVETKKSDSASD